MALERLGEEIVRAVLHGCDGRLDGAVRGHQDHFRVGRDGSHGAQQLLAAHRRHHQIGEHHVDRFGAQRVHRLLAAAGEKDAVTLAREDALEGVQVRLLVVDDEDGAAALHGGTIASVAQRLRL